MEINGLPLHPLVVHTAVVFAPLAALAALAYLVPRWRRAVRWPMLVLALVGTGAIVVTYLSGRSFLGSRPELGRLPYVQTHQDRAWLLLWATFGFGLVASVSAWWGSRTGPLRILLDVLLAASAVVVLVLVVLTGDAGARAVWG